MISALHERNGMKRCSRRQCDRLTSGGGGSRDVADAAAILRHLAALTWSARPRSRGGWSEWPVCPRRSAESSASSVPGAECLGTNADAPSRMATASTSVSSHAVTMITSVSGVVCLILRHDFQAVEVGHHEIDHENVRPQRADRRDGCIAISNARDNLAGGTEQAAEGDEDRRMIVGQHDSWSELRREVICRRFDSHLQRALMLQTGQVGRPRRPTSTIRPPKHSHPTLPPSDSALCENAPSFPGPGRRS